MGFLRLGRFFARKDISWRVRKPNAKQNRFQTVTIFLKTFFFSIFLRHYVTYVPAGFGKVLLALILGCHGRIERGDRGSGPPPPPEKSQKIRVSKQYWSGSPAKSQSYQASIQCWAIIGPPASDITFWIRAWLYFKELYFRKDIHNIPWWVPLSYRHNDMHNVRTLASS